MRDVPLKMDLPPLMILCRRANIPQHTGVGSFGCFVLYHNARVSVDWTLRSECYGAEVVVYDVVVLVSPHE